METEINFGMPDKEYFAIDAINQSRLKLAAKSPAHYQANAGGPSNPLVGLAFHAKMSGTFDGIYCPPRQCTGVLKNGNPCKNAAKAVTDKGLFCGVHICGEPTGQEILTQPEFEIVVGMAAKAKTLCSGNHYEVVILWDDRETGLRCKAKLDLIQSNGANIVAYDYKSCADASPAGFKSACCRYGYDIQAAFYMRALQAVYSPCLTEFNFVAVEKEPPFSGAVYSLDGDWMALADSRVSSLLQIVKNCTDANVWPGYQDQVLSAPAWFLKNEMALEYQE